MAGRYSSVLAAELVDNAMEDALVIMDGDRKDDAAQRIQERYHLHQQREATRETVHRKKEAEQRAALQIQTTFRGAIARRQREALRERRATAAPQPHHHEKSPETMAAPDPEFEQPSSPIVDDAGAFEIEIMSFDDRTPEQRSAGNALIRKYWPLGSPHFSSPLLARAFLQTVHEFEKREQAVRSRITKRIMDHVQSHWAPLAEQLHAAQRKEHRARTSLVHRETRFRMAELENEELERAAIVQEWQATLFGDDWAAVYADMCKRLVERETFHRKEIAKSEHQARHLLATEEATQRVEVQHDANQTQRSALSRHGFRPRPATADATPKKQKALYKSQQEEETNRSTGFAQNYTYSLVNLRTRCALQRMDEDQRRLRNADEVRDESVLLKKTIRDARIRDQTQNFAKSVKRRDEAKAKHKRFVQERDARNTTLREQFRLQELAGRRVAYEKRNPNEKDVFERLLTPLRRPKPQDELSAERAQRMGGSSPSRAEYPTLYPTHEHRSPSAGTPFEREELPERETFDPLPVYGSRPQSSASTQTTRARRTVLHVRSQLNRMALHSAGSQRRSRPGSSMSASSPQPPTRPQSSAGTSGSKSMHSVDAELFNSAREVAVIPMATQQAHQGHIASASAVPVVASYPPPEPILLDSLGHDALEDKDVAGPDVDTTELSETERVVRWNRLATQALRSGALAEADNHLMNAMRALVPLEQSAADTLAAERAANAKANSTRGKPPGAPRPVSAMREDPAIRMAARSVRNLKMLTYSQAAVVARRSKRLRASLQHLRVVLTEEEAGPEGVTPPTLLSVGAILTEINGQSDEALVYLRRAVTILLDRCRHALSTITTAQRRAFAVYDAQRRAASKAECDVVVEFPLADVSLQHPNLLGLCVSALHNIAIAQSVCPTGVESNGLLIPSERGACHSTHAAAAWLAKAAMGPDHPLTKNVEASSGRIAEAMSMPGST